MPRAPQRRCAGAEILQQGMVERLRGSRILARVYVSLEARGDKTLGRTMAIDWAECSDQKPTASRLRPRRSSGRSEPPPSPSCPAVRSSRTVHHIRPLTITHRHGRGHWTLSPSPRPPAPKAAGGDMERRGEQLRKPLPTWFQGCRGSQTLGLISSAAVAYPPISSLPSPPSPHGSSEMRLGVLAL